MTKEEFTELANLRLLGHNPDMIDEFIEYWTETSLNGKKMRFQGEKYFDVVRRFSLWRRMSLKYGKTLTPHEATLLAYNEAKKSV